MSIINDALKKAGQPIISGTSHINQQTSERAKSSILSEPNTTSLRIDRRKNTPNWGPFFVLGILLLVTGPIVAPVFFNNPSSKIHSAVSETNHPAIAGSSPKGQYAVEEMPAVTQRAPIALEAGALRPGFRLSGVVYSEAESYCLINGKVVKKGEEVNGAVVEKITSSEVVLNKQGEMITLPVEA